MKTARPQQFGYKAAMAVTCEQCGLKNPNSAVMCDCGWQLRAVDSKTLAGARAAREQVQRSVVKPISIGAALLVFVILVLKVLMSTV